MQVYRRGRVSRVFIAPLTRFRTHCALYSEGVSSEVRSRTREAVDSIGRRLGVTEVADWYTISETSFKEAGGSELLVHYSSLKDVLAAAYPEENWRHISKISTPRRGRKIEVDRFALMRALDMAQTQLGIVKPEDWYSVTLTDLKEVGFPTRHINKVKLADLLSERYPDYRWERVLLMSGKYAQQKRLENAVVKLFQNEEVKINTRKEAGIINPDTNAFLELDVWVPSLNIAFEYHEKAHYTSTRWEPLEGVQKRDAMKKQLVEEKGITLVVIPCWWDGREDSLVATIKQKRPDLLQNKPFEPKAVISETPPPGFLDSAGKEAYSIEDIGIPTTACFFTLKDVDLNKHQWWIFEKYDGVRGFWNPLKKTFFSRRGKKITVPQEVMDAMPDDTFLDGELWFGRSSFQEALKMVNKIDQRDLDWSTFRYVVFDIPNAPGSYAERYKCLVERVKDRKYLEVATYEECKGYDHLEEVFQRIVENGGEGIILRDPEAPYQPGRSPGYLKHKNFRDAEAKVIGPAGKHQWECELPNGVRFLAPAGTREFTKKSLKEGDIVSFKHRGFLFGTKKPKLPTLYRVRSDLTWQDVIDNWKENKRPSGLPAKRIKARIKSKGWWLKGENCRQFFCDLAKDMGFDPLVARNWEKITQKTIEDRKGHTMLKHHGYSVRKALRAAFPELKFSWREKNHWQDREDRVEFFKALAEKKGFDYANTDKWNRITTEDVYELKGGNVLLKHFGGSVKKALEATFPELTWKWDVKPRNYWRDVNNRRSFFLELAQSLNLDTSSPSTWKRIKVVDVTRHKGRGMLQLYGGSLSLALRDTFPELASHIKVKEYQRWTEQ